MPDATPPEPAPTTFRSVWILAGCLALCQTGSSLVMLTVALAGRSLLDVSHAGLATLPLAAQYGTTVLTTMPASLYMRRVGRRRGFLVGQAFGFFGSLLAAFALLRHSFVLFVVAGSLIGVHNAFWHYYRFAASEVAPKDQRKRAISLVLFGGVAAAVLGPELGKLSRDWFGVAFAGCYVLIAFLSTGAQILLRQVDFPKAAPARPDVRVRTVREILQNPSVTAAILASAIGYGVMVMLMAATPLAMQACEHSFGEAAFVIQWHTIAMFGPSFVTGILITRFEAPRIVGAGVALNVLCVAIAASGASTFHFFGALVALGVGWNFMFVGGTAILSECYEPEERAKVQALNDMCIFTVVAAASFSSGFLLKLVGWQFINFAALAPLCLVALAFLRLRRQRVAPLGLNEPTYVKD